jgi:hypothetical protein
VIESSQGHVNLFEDLEKVFRACAFVVGARVLTDIQQEMIISTKVKKPDRRNG